MRGADRLAPIVADRARYVNAVLLAGSRRGPLRLSLSRSRVSANSRIRHGGSNRHRLIFCHPRRVRGAGRRAPDAWQRAQSFAIGGAGFAKMLARSIRAVGVDAHPHRQCRDTGQRVTVKAFATQAELRELVDLAEADSVIEADEREMIHSVFELGETLAREVMVPNRDGVDRE